MPDILPGALGLTGLACSGKSTAAELLARRGWRVIDVDRVGHRVLDERDRQKELTRAFGSGILGGDGKVDRKRLGVLVFDDADALARLEAVVHPRMTTHVRDDLSALAGETVVVDAALLYPMGLDALCRAVMVVVADDAVRQKRAESRGWTADTLARRDRRLRPVLEAALAAPEGRAAVLANDGDDPDALDRALEAWLARHWR